MTRDGFPVLNALLGLVVLSSLLLLPLGFNEAPNPFSFLHIPTVLAQLLFIVAVFMNRKCRSRLGTLTETQKTLIAILFVYVAAVSYISPISQAFFLAYFWLIHIAFFVALLCFSRAAPVKTADPIWLVLGLASLLHVVAFMIALAIWPDRIRAYELPVFENIRFLGYLSAPASAVTAVWFATRREYPLLALSGFIAATFYIVYTGSRGGAVATVAGIALAATSIAFFRQFISASRIVELLVAAGAVFVLVGLLPKLPWPPLFDRAIVVVDQTGSQAISGRDVLWSDVAKVIRERWIWGYGPVFVTHAFQTVLDQANIKYTDPNIRNTHNVFLQLLLHWGVVGTMLIIATALSFTSNIWTTLRKSLNYTLLPVVVIFTMLVHSLVSGVFFYPHSTVIFIIAVASLILDEKISGPHEPIIARK